MNKKISKVLVWGLIACFCAAFMPGEALAKKAKHYDKRHTQVVVNVLHINDHHFGYARENRLTLRDLIVARTIAEESRGLDTEDVLRLMKRGHSHRNIANRYGINWRKIERRVDNDYQDMGRDAVKIGLTLWALDELLD